MGARDSGRSGLNSINAIYKANPSLLHRPILLLYDCDANKPDDEIGKLWVRSIPPNPENTTAKKGIENCIPEILFEDRFYSSKPSSKGDGGTTTELNKKALCHWICEERKNPDDFAKFADIVEILEKFSEAHPLH